MPSAKLLPFVDIAYQGFGRGLEEDAEGVRRMLRSCGEVIIAQSCDKNFSVYRDRVGSLFVKTGSTDTTARAMAHVFQRAREMWSMPPDHGAAAVRIVLDTPELRQRWPGELAAMRDRINSVRQRIASADPRLAYIGSQFGMFSMLPLSREQVLAASREARDLHGRQWALQRRGPQRRPGRSIYRRRGRGSRSLSRPWPIATRARFPRR